MKVAEDLMVKLQRFGLPDGYMGVWNPNIFVRSRYKWIYYVVEWILSDNEIVQVNNFNKPLIPASDWVRRKRIEDNGASSGYHHVNRRTYRRLYAVSTRSYAYGFR